MKTISVEQLRIWLEEEREVSIVDVRPLAERQEWAIPGSVHIDAYEALKAHDPEALVSLHLDASRPVVTVCAAGKTSQIAAADFVRSVLARLPAPPPNAERIVRLNEQGVLPEHTLTELEAGANRCAIF